MTKILLQHPHPPTEISGVVTFVDMVAIALSEAGCDVRKLSTANLSIRDLLGAARWADVIHMNSTVPMLMFWGIVFRKRIIQHYHFPFWGTWKQSPEDRSLNYWECFRRTISTFWSHGSGWRHTPRFLAYFGSSVTRLLVRMACAKAANVCLTVSKFISEDSRFSEPMLVVPYPVDFDAFETFSAVKSQPGVFAFVGRVTEAKGPQLLIDAVELLARKNVAVALEIVGDGDTLNHLKARVNHAGLGEQIHFHGRLSRDEAYSIMARSTAVLVPSIWDDPSPYTVLEASAMGRAVVGSERGGIPEIIGPGVIVPDANPQRIAEVLERLASDPAEAIALGLKCREFTRNRSHPDSVAQRLLSIYHLNNLHIGGDCSNFRIKLN